MFLILHVACSYIPAHCKEGEFIALMNQHSTFDQNINTIHAGLHTCLANKIYRVDLFMSAMR